MSWEAPSQWLPRRRQRQSEATPPTQKQVLDNNGARRRVTSGGSVIRDSSTKALGEDSTTATDSSFGLNTQTEPNPPELVVHLLENPIYEPIPETQSLEDDPLSELPSDYLQSRVNELHQAIVASNLATAGSIPQDEWMFD